MATPTAVQSVTVTLRAGVSDATLPNNVKMRFGFNYVISLDDWAKISSGARDAVVAAPTFNTAPYIVPGFTATNAVTDRTAVSYLLDLSTINNKSTIALVNSDAQAPKTFALGDVVQGFNRTAFKLVKVDAGSSTVAAGSVVVWGGDTTTLALQKAFKAASTVTSDISDVTDDGATPEFAGVAIGTITAGSYGWIQTEGTAYAVKVNTSVDAGEPVYVGTTDEKFDSGRTNATQVITLSSFGGTDSFKLTFMGNETAAIVRGTNAAASDVQTALEGIANIASGDILVTGNTDAGPYTVAFIEGGVWEGLAVTAITVTSPSGCTGVVATTVTGGVVAGTTVGTAITTADTGTANVEIRSRLFANRHRKTAKLFLDKN